jgi:hypothetical protein
VINKLEAGSIQVTYQSVAPYKGFLCARAPWKLVTGRVRQMRGRENIGLQKGLPVDLGTALSPEVFQARMLRRPSRQGRKTLLNSPLLLTERLGLKQRWEARLVSHGSQMADKQVASQHGKSLVVFLSGGHVPGLVLPPGQVCDHLVQLQFDSAIGGDGRQLCPGRTNTLRDAALQLRGGRVADQADVLHNVK